jgi:hypothetical protein
MAGDDAVNMSQAILPTRKMRAQKGIERIIIHRQCRSIDHWTFLNVVAPPMMFIAASVGAMQLTSLYPGADDDGQAAFFLFSARVVSM